LESITRLAEALAIPVAALFPPELAGGKAGASVSNGHTKQLVDILLVEDNADDVELTLHAFRSARFANRINWLRTGRRRWITSFALGNMPGATRRNVRR